MTSKHLNSKTGDGRSGGEEEGEDDESIDRSTNGSDDLDRGL